MYISIAEVAGVGHFPLDMLRYDSCYPIRAEDTYKLIERHDSKGATVRLARRATSKIEAENWTPDRWLSFGWGLKIIETRKVGRET